MCVGVSVCVCLLTPSPLNSANDNVIMGRARVCVCARTNCVSHTNKENVFKISLLGF